MLHKKSAIAVLASLAAAGCSSQPTAHEDVDAALSRMVISRSAFDQSYHKPCTNMQQCQVPLVCQHSRCEIPPSLYEDGDQNAPVLTIVNGGSRHTVKLEICDDRYTQGRGMMMRKFFAEGWGMLFVFDSDDVRHFWMQNTYIPLDMVFIRHDGTVSNVIENAAPLNTAPRYESTDKVRYVLELPVGSIARYQISPSSRLELPDVTAK